MLDAEGRADKRGCMYFAKWHCAESRERGDYCSRIHRNEFIYYGINQCRFVKNFHLEKYCKVFRFRFVSYGAICMHCIYNGIFWLSETSACKGADSNI